MTTKGDAEFLRFGLVRFGSVQYCNPQVIALLPPPTDTTSHIRRMQASPPWRSLADFPADYHDKEAVDTNLQTTFDFYSAEYAILEQEQASKVVDTIDLTDSIVLCREVKEEDTIDLNSEQSGPEEKEPVTAVAAAKAVLPKSDVPETRKAKAKPDPGKQQRSDGETYQREARDGRIVDSVWKNNRWLCPHGKQRAQCKLCGGSSICDHGKRKSQCKLCGGSSICEHGCQRAQCKLCGGSSICEHGKKKSKCKLCGGSEICEHGSRRYRCFDGPCGLIPSSAKCQVCWDTLVTPTSGVESTYICAGCRNEFGFGRVKKFEKQAESWFEEEGLIWSYSGKKLPCAPTNRYPDYVFAGREHCVVVEVDENQHQHYVPECEIARISEIMDSISFISLHVIRFNPHAKDLAPTERKATLIKAIRDAMETNFGVQDVAGCVVQYIGYSQDRIDFLVDLSLKLQSEFVG